MKCNHDDCFTCPHPDGILDDKDVVVDPVKLAEKARKRYLMKKGWEIYFIKRRK